MIDFAAFGWPQWVYLAWFLFCLFASARKSGQYVKVSGGASVIASSLTLLVLICGGFFS